MCLFKSQRITNNYKKNCLTKTLQSKKVKKLEKACMKQKNYMGIIFLFKVFPQSFESQQVIGYVIISILF